MIFSDLDELGGNHRALDVLQFNSLVVNDILVVDRLKTTIELIADQIVESLNGTIEINNLSTIEIETNLLNLRVFPDERSLELLACLRLSQIILRHQTGNDLLLTSTVQFLRKDDRLRLEEFLSWNDVLALVLSVLVEARYSITGAQRTLFAEILGRNLRFDSNSSGVL